MEKESNWISYSCGICGATSDSRTGLNLRCSVCKSSKEKPVDSIMYPEGFLQDKIPFNVLEILKDNAYFNRLYEETNKRIVGESPVKKSLVLTILGGRLVINSSPTSYNTLVQDKSGKGKDWVTSNVLALLPKLIVEKKSRISERAISYWHTSEKEPFFTWSGRVIYLEDISYQILNSECVKNITSGDVNSSIVVDGRLKDMSLNGNPIFVCTGAFVDLNNEASRRFGILNLSEDVNQTKRVMEMQAKFAKEGLPLYDVNLINSAYALKRVKVYVPFASELAQVFPDNHILARTGFGRFLDFIKASAALHQYSEK